MASPEWNTPELHAPTPRRDWALFLDIDGTLIDLAPTPDSVEVPDTLAPLLESASRVLDGALAVVSGRTIAVIDALLSPLKLPCAAEHGAVVRLGDGTIQSAKPEFAVPDDWKNQIRETAGNWPGVLVEYKLYSVAAHFRPAPERGPDVLRLFQGFVAGAIPGFEILPARMAYELRHHALTKAAAVHTFMEHTPFRGRTPVFVGDDVTDEDGFRAARDLGGVALHVTHAFGGQPANVRRWIAGFGAPERTGDGHA